MSLFSEDQLDEIEKTQIDVGRTTGYTPHDDDYPKYESSVTIHPVAAFTSFNLMLLSRFIAMLRGDRNERVWQNLWISAGIPQDEDASLVDFRTILEQFDDGSPKFILGLDAFIIFAKQSADSGSVFIGDLIEPATGEGIPPSLLKRRRGGKVLVAGRTTDLGHVNVSTVDNRPTTFASGQLTQVTDASDKFPPYYLFWSDDGQRFSMDERIHAHRYAEVEIRNERCIPLTSSGYVTALVPVRPGDIRLTYGDGRTAQWVTEVARYSVYQARTSTGGPKINRPPNSRPFRIDWSGLVSPERVPINLYEIFKVLRHRLGYPPADDFEVPLTCRIAMLVFHVWHSIHYNMVPVRDEEHAVRCMSVGLLESEVDQFWGDLARMQAMVELVELEIWLHRGQRSYKTQVRAL
jgi:hypothetical protein